MKLGPAIAVVVIVAALIFGGMAFKSSLVAYMPFSQAKAASSSGSTVQIMGVPVKGDTHYDTATGMLQFVLKDKTSGALMPVDFKNPKPDNFDEAISIAAIGQYSPAQKTFVADNLLVKCPSKYAGQSSVSTNRSYGAQT